MLLERRIVSAFEVATFAAGTFDGPMFVELKDVSGNKLRLRSEVDGLEGRFKGIKIRC